MEKVKATRSKSKTETNNCDKMENEEKKPQICSFYQVYTSWEFSRGCGSILGFDSQVYFIKTCDLSLAKEVFTYQLFGKKTEELSPAYAALNQSLMQTMEKEGKVTYLGQEDTLGVGNLDDVELILERVQTVTEYSFIPAYRLLRREDDEDFDSEWQN